MKDTKFETLAISVLALLASGVVPAHASNLLFQPQNPAVFPGANPGNSAALLASVKRPKDPSLLAGAGVLSPADIVQQSVLGQVSAQINDQIFNGNQASGSFDLGGGNLISYIRAGGNVIITLVNPGSGTTTITIPDL